MTDRDVAIERQALLRVARDLNGLVVSLDRLGSAYADRPRDEQALAINDYLDRWEIFARLARARRVVVDALDDDLDTEAHRLALDEEIDGGSAYWPSSGEPVVLCLTEGGKAALVELLAVALELRDDAYVVEHLPDDPWGDMAEFRDSIYVPLEHARSSRALEDPAERLILDAHEARPLFSVLEGLAESFSGGVPWVALTAEARDTVTWVLRQLA